MADTLLTTTLIDADGDTRTVPVFLPAATTEANIAAFATAYAPLLDDVVGGRITEQSYTKSLTLPGGLKTEPVEFSEVQKGALFSYANLSRYKWGLYVPTWLDILFVGDAIDLEGTGVAAFVDAYISGLASQLPTNGYAFDLTALAKSRKAFRK